MLNMWIVINTSEPLGIGMTARLLNVAEPTGDWPVLWGVGEVKDEPLQAIDSQQIKAVDSKQSAGRAGHHVVE